MDAVQSTICYPPSALRAAVLCPGPSLAGFVDRNGYNLRIGVNRAVGLFHCDYWAMLDERSFEITRPIGYPVIICGRGDLVEWKRRLPAMHAFHGYSVEEIAEKLPHDPISWNSWSATTAIVAAFSLGATSIDVWGMDWAGSADFDGYTDVFQNRTDERWAREAKLFLTLADELQRRGCTLRRVRSASPDVLSAGGRA